MTRRLLSLSFLALSACGSPPAAPVDAANSVDAAVATDAFVDPDTNVGNDADVTCWTLPTSGRQPPLPAACLPRCSAATFATYRACTDGTCIDATLDADTTPSVLIDAGNGQRIVLACGHHNPGVGWTCVRWQTLSVAAVLCPDQYDAYNNCARAATTSCTDEDNAMLACAQAAPGFADMFHNLVGMCFASS